MSGLHLLVPYYKRAPKTLCCSAVILKDKICKFPAIYQKEKKKTSLTHYMENTGIKVFVESPK